MSDVPAPEETDGKKPDWFGRSLSLIALALSITSFSLTLISQRNEEHDKHRRSVLSALELGEMFTSQLVWYQHSGKTKPNFEVDADAQGNFKLMKGPMAQLSIMEDAGNFFPDHKGLGLPDDYSLLQQRIATMTDSSCADAFRLAAEDQGLVELLNDADYATSQEVKAAYAAMLQDMMGLLAKSSIKHTSSEVQQLDKDGQLGFWKNLKTELVEKLAE